MCLHVRAGERIIERNSVACGELAAGAKFGPGPRPVFRFSAAAARFETLVTQSGADHGSDYRPGPGVTARGRREIMPRTQHRCTASWAAVRYANSRRVPFERHPARHAHIVQFVVHEGVGTHEATVSRIGPARPPLATSAGEFSLAAILLGRRFGPGVRSRSGREGRVDRSSCVASLWGAHRARCSRQLTSAGSFAQMTSASRAACPIPGTANVEGLPVRLEFPPAGESLCQCRLSARVRRARLTSRRPSSRGARSTRSRR